MRKYWFCFVLLVFGLVACGGDDDTPPTQLVVVTSSPLEETLQIVDATRVALQATNAALESTVSALQTSTVSVSSVVSETSDFTATPDVPTMTPMPTETIPPSAFPTPRVELISVVEQVFEGGRMFWFRESRTVWVLVGDGIDPESGDWYCFEDTFQEGDLEQLPTFEPDRETSESNLPDYQVQQPIRGFGKIWRENDDLREQLGFALTSEIEHSSAREYVAGGILDADQQYIPAPGEWRLHSFYGETVILLEDELGSSCPSGRWRLRYPPG